MRVESETGDSLPYKDFTGVLRTSPECGERKSSQGSESESRFSELTFHCKGYSWPLIWKRNWRWVRGEWQIVSQQWVEL